MLWLAIVALLAAPGALGAATPGMVKPGAFKLKFTALRGPSKHDLAPNREGGLVRREDAEGSAFMELTNEQTYYSCDLYVGSNQQLNTVLVDTGSSDLWIMDTDMVCLAALLYSKRDFSTFYRVVSLPLPDLKEEKEERNTEENYEEKRENSEEIFEEKRDDESEDLEGRDCIGPFCFSNIFTETGSGFGTTVSYSTVTVGATRTGSGSGQSDSAVVAGPNSCTSFGSFETADLDLFHLNSSAPPFSILYGDGTSAQGFWGMDVVEFNNHSVSGVSFAVVNETDSTFGVLGIGLPGLETTYSLGSLKPYMYENFPMRLVSDGIINKNVYSLYLDKLTSLTGSILFGAVDHAKYSGTLQSVPIINIYSQYYSNPIRIDVVLDSISLQGSSSNVSVTSVHVPALLDSGTTFTYLPLDVLERFTSMLSATYSSTAGLYSLSCDYNTDDAFAVFNFSGVEIKVPLSDLIVRYRTQCYLGVLEQTLSSYTYSLLGDNFLRNAYIVYDLDDYQVSMAQVVYTDEEDIEVISLSVPLATKAAGYSATSIQSDASDSGSVTQLSSSGLKKSSAERKGVSKIAILGLVIFSLVALL